jgi:hypothetical protein
MIWFYVRDNDRLAYEIRHEGTNAPFEIIATLPDGRQHLERFEDPGELLDKALRWHEELHRDGWKPQPPALGDPWAG